MVAAAVAAHIDSTRIRRVDGIGLTTSKRDPSLEHTVGVIAGALDDLPEPPTGRVVAERGEFYEEPAWTVDGSLPADLEFKYVESIGERRTVEIAHHAAYAVRNLLRTKPTLHE